MANASTGLDRPLTFPRRFAHTHSVQDEQGRTIHYTGWVFGLHFDGSDLRGGVGLRKEIEQPVMERVYSLRFYWRFPFVALVVTEGSSRRRTTWAVATPYSCDYFVHWDKYVTDEDEGWRMSYRATIIGLAANAEVLLTRELLEAVFEPIDLQLKELYHRIRPSETGHGVAPSTISLRQA